ncbi:MAG TPA: proline dehydrogenase family protein [Candidatus Limnocylindrales bacterium]
MRRFLLWMAANPWLRRRIPKLRFARRAVRRFMPGDDLESALAAGVGFQVEGLGTLYTRLGENLTRINEADAVADHYRGVIDEIRERRLDGEISVKLTQLGFDLDVERTFDHATSLAAQAAESGKSFWIDMEGSAYTEATIGFYERMKAARPNTAVCLQAYLRRTATDVQRLLPLRPEIRLVKGAYAEPVAVAYQTRHDVDANYLALCVLILHAIKAGTRVRLALGTHDVRLIEQVAEHAAAMGLPKTSFEIQMLYGIRMDQQRRLAREGYVVRDLIAYGEAWYPWYMRRLAERPANVLFALRQIVG